MDRLCNQNDKIWCKEELYHVESQREKAFKKWGRQPIDDISCWTKSINLVRSGYSWMNCPFQSRGDACTQCVHFRKECRDKTFDVEYQMSGAEIENGCYKTQHHHHFKKI
jgi:hypothetical protein